MTKVMGIVNVTPDSFSDGGQFFRPEEAVRRALNLIDDGADIIDLGGESTKPGATPIGWEEEWARLEPVLAALLGQRTSSSVATPVSVDTYHPETAERAIAAGAKIINCVYAEPIPKMLELCAATHTELVVPAKCLPGLAMGVGIPQSRRDAENVLSGALSQTPAPLCDSLSLRETDFSFSNLLYLDPMIGFGTTREEDLALLRSIPELAKKGRVLVGASRKRIVKKLTGEKVTGKNLGGNVAIAVWAAMSGASVVRVHDVKETVQALRVIESLNDTGTTDVLVR